MKEELNNMNEQKQIKRQITKFGFYGFFKDLRFFDPVLLIFLHSFGISAFQIGLLYAIREAIIYIFEIPSGVFADQYGKKTELMICFMFYISSFVVFAFGTNFYWFALAMTLFGLGEAFRSGTHKSMIMQYLDMHNLSREKSKTYGKTRSYSMIGSMLSSLFTIYLVIALPELKFLFLLAIIPYLLDLILIATYPNELNERKHTTFKFKEFLSENKKALTYAFSHKKIRNVLIRSSSYSAVFKILKDYVQLILISMPLTLLLFSRYSSQDQIEIYASIMYAFIFLMSAFTTRFAYLLLKYKNHDQLTRFTWVFTGFATLLIGFFINQLLIVFIGFILIYICLNIRKPLIVEVMGDYSDKDKRASILSIDSQLTSLLIVICAPLLGLIADHASYQVMFIIVGAIMVLTYIVSLFNPKRMKFQTTTLL